MKHDTVFASVDELVEYPDEGLPYELSHMAQRMRGWDIHTTMDACAALGLENLQSITTPVQTFVGNMAEYVQVHMMETYKKHTQPVTDSGHVEVFLGLKDVKIMDVDVAVGNFEVSFWLEYGWSDPRLAWNKLLYDGTLHIAKEDLWMPDVYMSNTQSVAGETRIFEPAAIVSNTGEVKVMVHFNAILTCVMDATTFPFDRHDCSVNIAVFAKTKEQQLTIDTRKFEFSLDASQTAGWQIEKGQSGA